jgi:hypothetical protein
MLTTRSNGSMVIGLSQLHKIVCRSVFFNLCFTISALHMHNYGDFFFAAQVAAML